jgi:TRAP transporter TAXI family solute receptor
MSTDVKQSARRALARRQLINRLIAAAAVALLLVTAWFWMRGTAPRRELKMSAGDALGHRHALLQALAHEAAPMGLEITIEETAGSKEALTLVDSGKLDAALVQGDTGVKSSQLRQAAILTDEPLHLFVRPELVPAGPSGLRNKRLNLGPHGGGTRKVALQVLRFIGLTPEQDYRDEARTYAELAELSGDELPDGIFAVSALPWELGATLVREHGFRLMELPFGEAMTLTDRNLDDSTIPAYTYSVAPAVPERPLHTVAPHLLLVTHKDVEEDAIVRLMEVLFESDFTRRASLSRLDPHKMEDHLEYPLHDGAKSYLHRNEPLMTNEDIESVENLRSFVVSGLLAAFIAWRWWVRRRMIGFEKYLDAVTEIELDAFALEQSGVPDTEALLKLRRRLTEVKGEALEKIR